MANTSATGGYLSPTNLPLPGGLTLQQFIQTVIVGVSGYTNTRVRPKWQSAPPKQPNIDDEWIAYSIAVNTADANAYVGMDEAGNTTLNRHETLDIQLSFYGPNAGENLAAFRDGFQIQQNLEAMRLAKMGFKGISSAIHAPDLVNERWFNRYEMTLTLMRQVLRSYPVLSFASAVGVIHTVLVDPYNIDWSTPDPEEP